MFVGTVVFSKQFNGIQRFKGVCIKTRSSESQVLGYHLFCIKQDHIVSSASNKMSGYHDIIYGMSEVKSFETHPSVAYHTAMKYQLIIIW